MRLSTMMFLLSIALAGLAGLGLWQFAVSYAPVPDELRTSIGEVTRVENGKRGAVLFQVAQRNGGRSEFTYTPQDKNYSTFAEQVKKGMVVEVKTGPGGSRDFWGVKLGPTVLMTPVQAREHRLKDGRWGLGIGIAGLLTAIWALREALAYRRRRL